MNLIENLFRFYVNLTVILVGLISLANLAGSLLIFSHLGRPAWEVAILIAVSLFIFTWFSVLVSAELIVRWIITPYFNWKSEKHSRCRSEGKEEEAKGIEEARKDISSQIERRELEVKVDELRRLREEGSKVGSMAKAEEYSKQIEKHEATLKERGDRSEDEPWHIRAVQFFMTLVVMVFLGLLYLMIPMFMLLMTGLLWDSWAGGSEWMRSPGAMIAVIFSCLVLACVGAWGVSWHFGSDESETKKKIVEQQQATGQK